MNKTTTLLAVAGVMVIGALGGFLFLGSQQPQGSFLGSLGPTSTTLTLVAGPCMADEIHGTVIYALSGKLLDSSGNPVAGRTIGFERSSCGGRGELCQVSPPSEWVVTNPDGSFSLGKNEPPTANLDAGGYVEYRASFAGDELYAASSSSTVRKLC